MKCNNLAINVAVGVGLLASSGAASAVETTACDFTSENPDVVSVVQSGCAVNSTIFTVPDDKISVGTGTIDSFLTVQEKGESSNYSESGFNSDNGPPGNLQTDRYGGGGRDGFNNSILLSEIPLLEINGTWYREFLLDINQESKDPHLSLNALRLFGAPGDGSYNKNDPAKPYNYDVYSIPATSNDTTGRPGYMSGNTFMSDASLIWGLDNGPGGDLALLLDYDLCGSGVLPFSCPKGSGRDYDIRWLVPNTLFGAFDSNDWIILYTSFGWTGGGNFVSTTYGDTTVRRLFSRNDGFEEWAIRICENGDCSPPDVPEPGTLALLGLGLLGLGMTRRREKSG